LDATAKNGSTIVPGSYAYSNGTTTVNAATVLSAGSYTLHVTFTPTDATDYATATATTTLTVAAKIVPVISWSTPAAIVQGTNLSGVLDATAKNGSTVVSGSYAYSNGTAPVNAATVLSAGSYTLHVTFTPTDITDYATATQSAQLVVNAAISAATDFTMTVNPETLTITAGSSGSAALNITPVGGFNNPLQLRCSGLPANSTCTFSSATVTPNGAPITTRLTITTNAPAAALAIPPTSAWTGFTVLRSGVGFGGLLALCFLPRKKTRVRWQTFLQTILVVATLGAGISALGCGTHAFSGEAGASNTQAGGNTGSSTVDEHSTVIVTASSSTSGGISHSANLALTIAD
jgi:hypothetical protein